eukprot:Nitzschia sp. Nitz4//scaffold159_size51929//22269//22601//NITZ4_006877-RA/size51929-processed-gene-0.6-mRNA-1//1//CDS//3329537568//4709//frame0
MNNSRGNSSTSNISSTQYSSNSSYKRSRSRAIAIKHDANVGSDSEDSLDTRYDEATWRMYHQIITHRQKHHTVSLADTSVPSTLPETVYVAPVSLEQQAEQDDDIFQMDL